jgi:hypothetical protein
MEEMKDKVAERLINHIWDEQHLISSALKTSDGVSIEILYQGRWNPKEGPDFKGARARVGDKVVRGDVEVHIRASDWNRHGHDRDSRYDGVILHVVLFDDLGYPVRNSKGEPIPTVPIAPFLDSSMDKLWIGMEMPEGGAGLQGRPCYGAYELLGPERIMAILEEAGWRRLWKKRKPYLEAGSNRDQIAYEMFMDSLGYSRNREPFGMLAKAIPYRSLFEIADALKGDTVLSIQAALLACSNLLPYQDAKLDEETRAYVSKIKGIWSEVKEALGDIEPLPRSSWICSGARPENHPARRIGAASYFLAKSLENEGIMALLWKAVKGKPKEEEGRSSLIGLLSFELPENEYWAYRYSFGGRRMGRALLSMGRDRANDIVINVFIPALSALAIALSDNELLSAMEQMFLRYPSLQENEITRYMSKEILGGKRISKVGGRAIHQQGFIGIYKDFCEDRLCNICPIGASLG